jgi:hypothetical protein
MTLCCFTEKDKKQHASLNRFDCNHYYCSSLAAIASVEGFGQAISTVSKKCQSPRDGSLLLITQ